MYKLHIMGCMKSPVRIKLMAVKKMQSSCKRLPAIENLRDQSKIKEYNIALSNRFKDLPVDENLDNEWEFIKEGITEVSINVLGECWCEHFSELLNPATADSDLSDLDSLDMIPCFPYLEDSEVMDLQLEQKYQTHFFG